MLEKWWAKITGPRGRDASVIALSAVYTGGAAVLLAVAAHPVAGVLELVVGGLGTAALIWRRRRPLLVTAVGIPVYVLTGNVVTIGFGLMRVAIARRDRKLVIAAAAVAIALAVPVAGSSDRFGLAALLGGSLGALFFALWGAYIGVRRDLITSLEGRAERAERERELRAAQARLEERSRIAGEMHDVLAHRVSLIALQAGGLEVNPDIDSEVVQRTAALIGTTARQALEDLRDVLGLLRNDQTPGESELTPQPDIADLDRLVESSRAAGVPVSLDVEVDPGLSPQLGRAVYRIIQEGLTNVHKHARGSATAVVAAESAGRLVVSVTNGRPAGAASPLPGTGSGLIGLRERVAVLGGSLQSGPTPDGGWSVKAVLPVPIGPERPGAASSRQQRPVLLTKVDSG